jgi:hypothetical protein
MRAFLSPRAELAKVVTACRQVTYNGRPLPTNDLSYSTEVHTTSKLMLFGDRVGATNSYVDSAMLLYCNTHVLTSKIQC